LGCIGRPFGGGAGLGYSVHGKGSEIRRWLTLTVHFILVWDEKSRQLEPDFVNSLGLSLKHRRYGMKKYVIWVVSAMTGMLLLLTAHAIAAPPAEYTLTVLNPQGPVKKSRDLAPRLKTLEGKKVALWLSATPDQVYAGKGAELYDLLEKMLKEKFPGIDIISYKALPKKFAPAKEVVAAIAGTKPDAVVAGFGG
jgi:hypothetical protein